MCAMIASGLCAPMILGLPFLIHNNIIVDASARTVIDKKIGLKEFYQELQEDHKLMVAELKMACNDHLIHTQHKFKMVALVDVTATVQQHIEILAANKNFRNSDSNERREIPHFDELPTDVYCQIKLNVKDSADTYI